MRFTYPYNNSLFFLCQVRIRVAARPIFRSLPRQISVPLYLFLRADCRLVLLVLRPDCFPVG